MRYRIAVAALALFLNTAFLRAAVTMPAVFSEGMVLQRGMEVPVWGWADEGEAVRVRLLDRGAKALAEAETVAREGTWRVTLAPLPAGGRYTLLVEGKNKICLTNVLVGEVWLTCGQSNMIWPIENTASIQEARAQAADYPLIRHCQLGHRAAHEVTAPERDNAAFWGKAKWEEATYLIERSSRSDIPGCQSAVSYYFARELTRHLENKVPVGMLDVGAILRVESWVDAKTVAASPALADLAGKPYPHATSRAFMANIAPLAPYALRGAIYYQGEMNAGGPEIYRHGLMALIRSWRAAWGRPELPFLFVQLPGFIKHTKEKHALDMSAAALALYEQESREHSWCRLREAQLAVWQAVPRTGMAITIDLGAPYDIHPPRKREVAERLFRHARALAYGEGDVVVSGPVPATARFEGAKAVVVFEHVAEGLRPAGEPVKGFELAGADGVYHAASAAVQGDTVAVTAPEVTVAKAVRYAWAGFPVCNLGNTEGLPATPFRFPVAPTVDKP